jgi:hypothetical protein
MRWHLQRSDNGLQQVLLDHVAFGNDDLAYINDLVYSLAALQETVKFQDARSTYNMVLVTLRRLK